ncbi:hypothetical protein ANOM_011452, partial [Aspergillus nomiae NRRL 13137]
MQLPVLVHDQINFWKRSDWIIGSPAVLEPYWLGGDSKVVSGR